MRRRTFITGFGCAAIWPLVVHAQQPVKLPTIGFLGATSPDAASHWVGAFVRRLKELGWIEGRTVAIEYRWAEADAEHYGEIATEFVRLKVDVIVTWASAPVLAAKHATTLIPIVFAAQMDPVGAGVVASLARPGGNVTGMSIQQTDTAGKRIELLREVAPNLSRLAILANAGAPGAMLEMREVQRRLVRSASKSRQLKFARQMRSFPLSGHSKTGRTHSTSRPTRLSTATASGSTPWQVISDYRQFMEAGTMPMRER